MNNKRTKQGFTLIELLVVVLIIGILAAVALPQYQVAVAKSRLTRLIPAVKAIKTGAEVYYLANAEYLDDVRNFDIGEIAGCSSLGSGHIDCSDFWIDMQSGIFDNARQAVVGFAAPKGTTAELAYAMYFDNSAFPNRIECWAEKDNQVANAVCKSLGGTLTNTYAGNAEFYNANVYQLQ